MGHHGSTNATSHLFLNAVSPSYAVISVGKDNDYGHPHDITLNRLADAGVTILRTDLLGDITCVSDGSTLTFTAEKNARGNTRALPEGEPEAQSGETPARELPEGAFIGNVRSKVFHLPSCPNLPAEKNRIPFASREEAVSNGYTPCGNCKP